MFITSILITVLLKYSIIVLLGVLIYKYTKSILETYVASYVLTQILLNAGMFLLSINKNMEHNYMILYMCLVLGILLLCIQKSQNTYQSQNIISKELLSGYNVLSCTIFLCLALYIGIHSLYYFDCMTDAYCYGITRIELWVQKKSLLIDMNSVAKNIFVNEWNGDLCGVFWEMMTGTSQGIMIGNAENFFNAFVILAVAGKYVGIKAKYVGVPALIISATPIMVTMAMTVKGDFLSMLYLPLGFSYFYCALVSHESKKKFYIILCLAVMGMAAGCKLPLAAAAGLSGVLLTLTCLKKWKNYWQSIMLGGCLAILGCMRYVINLLFYQSPFVRVGCEKIYWNDRFRMLIPIWRSFRDLLKEIWNFDDMHTFRGGSARS